MSALAKAKLAELKGDKPADGIEVQFNPTSLRMTIANTLEKGDSQGKEARQYIGSSVATLSMDLIFDTADEGETGNPRSVRERTAMVERFVRPKKQNNDEKQVAPKLHFSWEKLIFIGIADSITIDFDHFAADGKPLRAKVSLSIKEQDPSYMFLESGPGANRGGKKPTPGGAMLGAAGSIGASLGASAGLGGGIGLSAGVSGQVGFALGGESAAEFAARAGVDPAAWRGLDLGGGSSLSLTAGAEVGFSAALGANLGLGVTAGIEAGAAVSLEASFGLEASAGLSSVSGVGINAGLAAGFNLSAAGGVGAAIESVQTAKIDAAAQAARAAFASSSNSGSPRIASTANQAPAGKNAAAPTAVATASAPRPALPQQPRSPVRSSGIPSTSQQAVAPPAPAPPRADPRAKGFGFGVPLRSTIGAAANRRAGAVHGHVALRPQTGSGTPPETFDPTTAPWTALPVRERSRSLADKAQQAARPKRPCGCAGACRHGRGS